MLKYYNDFLELLRKTCKKSTLVLVESTNYKIRKFLPLDTCDVEDILSFIKEHRAVSFCTADESKIFEKYSDYHAKAIADYDPIWKTVEPAETPEAMYELLNRYNFPKGAAASDISYKPVIMVDIDLQDFREKLEAENLLPPEIRGCTKNELKEHLMDLPGDVKLEYIKKLLPIDLIITETRPMLILYTGNGVHFWYYSPFKLTQDMYKSMHKALRTSLQELVPDIEMDEAATMLNQNVRLPYTYNLKGKHPIECVILHKASTPEVTQVLKDAKVAYKPLAPKKAAEATQGEIRKFFETSRPYYKGLRNLQRDSRMYQFIKENLSFEGILEYTATGVDNVSVHEDYLMCCSPLRQDSNPSFLVSPSRMICRDMGRGGEEIDYGQLMQELINRKKIEFRMPAGTTRYEAEFHCILCAYINYISSTGNKTLPMCDLKLHEAMVKKIMAEQKLSKAPANLKIPEGFNYYLTLQSQLTALISYRDRHPEEGAAGLLRYLIESIPSVYYFYDRHSQMSSKANYLKNVTALSLIWYINSLKLGICMNKNKLEMYIVNANGLHEPWGYSSSYGLDSNKNSKDEDIASLQLFFNDINALEAGSLPPGTQTLSRQINSTLCKTRFLHDRLNTDLKKVEQMSDRVVKKTLSKNLGSMYPGVNVASKDLEVNMLSTDRYIEFNNYFVLYDAEDVNRIGEKLPNTVENRADLMSKAIVDTRIRLDYPKNPEPTPMFDAYLNSMTYGNNHFDKVIRYFTGSMLYMPSPETRAVFLYGRSGDNGKSVLAEILQGIFANNKHYVTQKSITHISDTSETSKTARAEMVDAIINITPDSTKEKIGMVFKQMVVGEAVQVRRLYQAERDVRLRCHFMVMTNTLPGTHSETFPFKKRALISKVNRTIPMDERIPELGKKIANLEAGNLWPWILENCKVFRRDGISGFLTEKEIEDLEKEILEKDELYNFIKDYVVYDPNENWNLTETTFKRLYNQYRGYVHKNLVRSDSIFDEAELYICKIFAGQIPSEILDKGFSYRTSTRRGLPVRLYVPANTVGNHIPIDSADNKS